MDHSTPTDVGLVTDAKSAGRWGAPTARDSSLFDGAIGGDKTGLPRAGKRWQGAGRRCGLHPGQESEMAQVAAVRVAVLVNAAGQRDGGQKRAQKNQAGKRPLGGRNLLCRDADGPYSIAARKAGGAGSQQRSRNPECERRSSAGAGEVGFPELEGRFSRMSGRAERGARRNEPSLAGRKVRDSDAPKQAGVHSGRGGGAG